MCVCVCLVFPVLVYFVFFSCLTSVFFCSWLSWLPLSLSQSALTTLLPCLCALRPTLRLCLLYRFLFSLSVFACVIGSLLPILSHVHARAHTNARSDGLYTQACKPAHCCSNFRVIPHLKICALDVSRTQVALDLLLLFAHVNVGVDVCLCTNTHTHTHSAGKSDGGK